jgi:peptidoglycan/LPS O-acetylase OafA/YrhL
MGILRVLLALAVVVAHSDSIFGLELTGGMVAVEIFFIISGFYMAMILDKKYVGAHSYRLFISNRFLRLFPLYWVVATLTILASVISYTAFGHWGKLDNFFTHIETMDWQTLFMVVATNLLLFGQDVVMFFGYQPDSGSLFFSENFTREAFPLARFLLLPQAWTLSIEFMFYLIAPFLVRRHIGLIITLIAASLGIRLFIYLGLGLDHEPWTYRFFPNELALFLLGVVSYRMYLNMDASNWSRKQHLLICVPLFIFILFYPELKTYWFNGHLRNTVIYLYAAFAIPHLFMLSKRSAWDNKIGELSYPVYIVHLLVIYSLEIIYRQIDFLNSFNWHGELAAIISVMVSLLLIKYIADPVERVRQARVLAEKQSTASINLETTAVNAMGQAIR